MREGILAAIDVALQVSQADGVNAVGYCVGGTLLAVALAYMAATGDDRIKSATLFATQVDFTHAGDLKVFVDEEQIADLEKQDERCAAISKARKMAAAFNMLRAERPDLALCHQQLLQGQAAGRLRPALLERRRHPDAGGEPFLLSAQLLPREPAVAGRDGDRRHHARPPQGEVPIYNLATREDHIAPPRSVFYGSSFFGGPVHLRPRRLGPHRRRRQPSGTQQYQYWTGAAPKGDRYEEWLARAEEHPGSWWPHWQAWIEAHDDARVKPRRIGGGKIKAIEAAPGSYVQVKS